MQLILLGLALSLNANPLPNDATVQPPTEGAIGGWGGEPELVWLDPEETAWAQPLHPTQITVADMVATYEPPPRAAWCDGSGMVEQPSVEQCDTYDLDLESWMLYFTGANDPSALPDYSYPYTYCGGC